MFEWYVESMVYGGCIKEKKSNFEISKGNRAVDLEGS